MNRIKSTTIFACKKDKVVAIASDGQATLGDSIIKHGTKKVRLLDEGRVAVGFAGSTADAIKLTDMFEKKLNAYPEQFVKAAVELATDWRQDKVLRRLEASLLATNGTKILLLSGSGDIIEPDDDVMGIGSGANYAIAAGRALLNNTKLTAKNIVRKSMEIAGDLCIYTNKNITLLEVSEHVE